MGAYQAKIQCEDVEQKTNHNRGGEKLNGNHKIIIESGNNYYDTKENSESVEEMSNGSYDESVGSISSRCPVIGGTSTSEELLKFSLSLDKMSKRLGTPVTSRSSTAKEVQCPFAKNFKTIVDDHKGNLSSALISMSPVPIIGYSSSGTIQVYNRAAERVFEYLESDVVGYDLSTLILEEDAHSMISVSKRHQAKNSAMFNQRVVIGRRCRGELFPIEVSFCQVVDSGKAQSNSFFIAYLKDLTVDVQLLALHKLNKKVVNLSTIPVVGMDSTCIVRIFNEAAASVFRYSREEVLGQNIKMLMPERLAKYHDKYVNEYLTTGKKRVLDSVRVEEGMRKGGELFPIELKATEIVVADNKRWFIGFVRDLSEVITKSEQNALTRLTNQLFPPTIAAKIAQGETSIHNYHKEVSIAFLDIVGFTTTSSILSAQEIVTLLDQIFRGIDNLLPKYTLLKIKSIGDAYMIGCGFPNEHPDHAKNIVEGAFEILDIVKEINDANPTLPSQLQVRVGINSGDVIAGIVGTTKPQYDCWGDTVNLSSRMESSGVPSEIQITEETFSLLPAYLQKRFVVRIAVPIKGKGLIDTYITNIHGKKRSSRAYLRARPSLIDEDAYSLSSSFQT